MTSTDAPHGQHDHSKTEPAIREILSSLGLSSARLRWIESWSQSAWTTDEVVVRYRIIGPTGRLTHEAAVASRLLPGALYPEVVASGCWGRDDWLVTTLIPGEPLLETWPRLTTRLRETATHEASAALRALHLSPARDLRPPCLFGGAPLVERHDFIDTLATAVRSRGTSDGLAPAVLDRLDELRTVIDDEPTVMAHHDFRFDHCIWRNGHVVGLVDLEMSHAEAPDWDLPVLLGMCANPREAAGAELGAALRPGDFAEVPRWFRDAYPEPFAHSDLILRLRIYEIIYKLASLTSEADLRWMLDVLERGVRYESLVP